MKNNEQQYGNLSDEQFEQYLALIKRMYERMQRENSWPWVSQTDEPTPPEQQQVQGPKAN